jgi:hypothetical protein
LLAPFLPNLLTKAIENDGYASFANPLGEIFQINEGVARWQKVFMGDEFF